MMNKILLLITLIGASLNLQAQKISGFLKDENGKPIPAATIILKKQKDSSIIKYGASTKDGAYFFNGISNGDYFLYISHVGNITSISPVIKLQSNDVVVKDIVMVTSSAKLAEVTVTSKKPIVEVRADKTILNVEGTINAAGNDALELLRKSPGVMVDKDDNLSLAGKNGVQVYIDGKPSPLSGTDLSNYLKSLQATQIESIELITNPSAKYEAAGNAGIINIKFKKNKSLGTNGSVNAGYAIGTYAKYNGGVSLNNRNAKVNLFGSYNYNRGLNLNSFVLDRNQGDTFFSQTNKMKMYNNGSHNFKTGIDYFINKKNTIGIMIYGNIADMVTETEGPMQII